VRVEGVAVNAGLSFKDIPALGETVWLMRDRAGKTLQGCVLPAAAGAAVPNGTVS